MRPTNAVQPCPPPSNSFALNYGAVLPADATNFEPFEDDQRVALAVGKIWSRSISETVQKLEEKYPRRDDQSGGAE